jgi:hypothetical protein
VKERYGGRFMKEGGGIILGDYYFSLRFLLDCREGS